MRLTPLSPKKALNKPWILNLAAPALCRNLLPMSGQQAELSTQD